MPRAAKTSSETVEKKTPCKRAAPKKKTTATKPKAAPKKTTRKKPVASKTLSKKKITEAIEANTTSEAESDTETVSMPQTTNKRKAPTSFASNAATKRASRNQMVVIGGLLVIGVSASAVVGFTDSKAGQIDVAQTIQERNARMANMVDVDGPTIVAPRQNTNNAPDGGFIGVTPTVPEPVVVDESASSTATSTSAVTTASSTQKSNEDLAVEISTTATTTVTAVNAEEEQI